jgi:integrase
MMVLASFSCSGPFHEGLGDVWLQKLTPKQVQEILGHSQIIMTLDTYSHVLPSMQEDVTKLWEGEFGGPKKA